ncbi:hypothetical protein TNCV_122191 [Trichonephila clavipes]|nr:hypothetical protein TNCV_122191 [Trichonephila clavipes]
MVEEWSKITAEEPSKLNKLREIIKKGTPYKKIQSSKYRIQQQYSQNKSQKVFRPSTELRHNYQCLKYTNIKEYSQAITRSTAEYRNPIESSKLEATAAGSIGFILASLQRST